MKTNRLLKKEKDPSTINFQDVLTQLRQLSASHQYPQGSTLGLRVKCLDWLNTVDKDLYIARSTLSLAFELLDRFILSSFSLEESTFEVVAGTVLLLSTKFNEIYAISADELSSYSITPHTLEEYEEIESQIL